MTVGTLPPPHKIIERFYLLKKDKNNSYSVRALARDLGFSISYVSGLLTGKKKIPHRRIEKICATLAMDEIAIQMLKKSILQQILIRAGVKPSAQSSISQRRKSQKKRRTLESFVEVSPRLLRIWQNWYTVAIMDLVTCTNFMDDPIWIAKRFEIREDQVKASLRELQALGLITRQSDGRWTKNSERLRLPTAQSFPSIRHFHQEMMKKAAKVMISGTSQKDFSTRSISGITMAGNPQNFEMAKAHLIQALYECAEILSEGDCTEVYQLNNQLFQLTRKL
jgi:uncharacterized protein (TIGR02147 family)